MPRQPRVVAVDVPHHITQRGNNRQTVLHTDADRLSYLDLLRQKSHEHDLSILGWCLMPNHVHIVAVPARLDSMAKAVGQTHHRHALRYNRLQRRSGHLWQGRFRHRLDRGCPLGPNHLIEALAYADLNHPVRTRLAERPEAYRWSSAQAHITRPAPTNLLDDWRWSDIAPTRDWAEVLAARPAGRSFERRLQTALRHGRPLGDQAFIDALAPKAMAAGA